MGAASAIGAGLGIAGGLYNTIAGAKEKRAAQNALNNYDRQELTNSFEGAQVSQLGSDNQREDLARNVATSVDALRSGGARTLVGGIGRLNAGANAVNAKIAADLDQQQK